MRELVFKNLTSRDHMKRDVFVQETVERDGILASSERRCLYFIKDSIKVDNPTDLTKLVALKKQNECAKKRFHVLKTHDSKTGVDKLICKVKGTFYAVVQDTIFCIVFVHSFKIKFTAKPAKKI